MVLCLVVVHHSGIYMLSGCCELSQHSSDMYRRSVIGLSSSLISETCNYFFTDKRYVLLRSSKLMMICVGDKKGISGKHATCTMSEQLQTSY